MQLNSTLALVLYLTLSVLKKHTNMQCTFTVPVRGHAEASCSGRRPHHWTSKVALVETRSLLKPRRLRNVETRVAEDTRPTTKEPTVRVQGVKAYRSVTDSMDYDLLYSSSIDCPLGGVESVMRANDRGVLTCSPGETLESIVPRLSKVTGLPVLSTGGRVVGVISRKDIIRVRKAQGTLLDTVEKHMTTPAITIKDSASVQEAADLMLTKRIRRLPVVNAEGYPVGILARSDIFKPLFIDQYTEYMDKEVAAMTAVLALPGSPPPPPAKKKKKITWAVKYLYDGDCAMCQSLKKVLERQDNGRGKVKFVNIASPDYNPSKNMGIEYDEAMETIHAIRPDGEVLYGTDALRAMFSEVGLGWAANLSEWPLLSALVDIIYKFLSANRISLGGAMDAIIAAKRVEMSKAGVETCSDVDEECKVEW